ncbi:hypothetical protein RN001_012900 [Aquatica leii]|uniref:Uncharacterized protein n=1 Tax=Aquatica leii TaxID=1421715 RepID=A0AAN7SMN5_9COLE|nr:hypothetical protein RN001_012900 [Aquatica leii]
MICTSFIVLSKIILIQFLTLPATKKFLKSSYHLVFFHFGWIWEASNQLYLSKTSQDNQNDDPSLSSSEPDPFATNYDSDDSDFVPSDTEYNSRGEQQQVDIERRNVKKKCRKKMRHTESLRRNVIRSSRNSGAEYVNWKYALHLKNRDLSRQLKNNDKELACQSSTLCTAVFDLQQVLPVSKSNVGLAYYKLKLSTYNFKIFKLATKDCQCYMWYECIAKKGSSEIGNNCAGQNRNKYLFALYSYLSQKHSAKIRHTFVEPGNTQTEGDCVHSVIEKASRHIPVYTPEQCYSVVRTAKRKKPYYTVYELSQKDVYDLKGLQAKIAINFDKDDSNDKFLISKFKMVEFNPDSPNFLFFKMNYADNNFKKVNLIRRGRKQLNIHINDTQLTPLFKDKIPLQKILSFAISLQKRNHS